MAFPGALASRALQRRPENAKQSFKNLTDKGEVCLSTTIRATRLSLTDVRSGRYCAALRTLLCSLHSLGSVGYAASLCSRYAPPPGLRCAMLAPPVAPSVSLVGLWGPRSGRSGFLRSTPYRLRTPCRGATVTPSSCFRALRS